MLDKSAWQAPWVPGIGLAGHDLKFGVLSDEPNFAAKPSGECRCCRYAHLLANHCPHCELEGVPRSGKPVFRMCGKALASAESRPSARRSGQGPIEIERYRNGQQSAASRSGRSTVIVARRKASEQARISTIPCVPLD